jgi:hypothetical protein
VISVYIDLNKIRALVNEKNKNNEQAYAGTLFDEVDGKTAFSCMSYYSGLCE